MILKEVDSIRYFYFWLCQFESFTSFLGGSFETFIVFMKKLWCRFVKSYTVKTTKFGSHFCSIFSAELCSFRTWKILLSSDDMDELLSSDHMNELCNYELKSSDICSELLSCQNQWGNDEVKALMQGHTSSACYLTVQRMCSPDVNTLLSVSNSHCSVSAFIV